MIPLRRSNPASIAATSRTFFVTSSTAQKRNLLQSGRSAELFIDVLYHYRAERQYLLHAFVVMPDHFHVLITIGEKLSIECAVQLIKGGFSFRAGKELGFQAPVWERGFSEVRIHDAEALTAVQQYIEENPVKRHLAAAVGEFPFCSAYPGFELDEPPPGLKPRSFLAELRHG